MKHGLFAIKHHYDCSLIFKNFIRIAIQLENKPEAEPLIEEQDSFENKISEMEQLLTMVRWL